VVLKVKLFGRGQASYLDHPLIGFPNQQSWLLLCYLLLNKMHPQNRERLSAVFWGDQPAPIARKNFRNTLWRLRQMLFITGMRPEDYLHISDESITIIQYAPCWLDVEIFEAAAHWAHLPDADLQPEQVSELEMAVDLYTGDLLENNYEDWCIYDRERLRLMNLNMLHKLMVTYSTAGKYETGLCFGERILCYDNTREDIHRQMMWMYWRSGNLSGALAQYKLCAQIMRDEVGVRPMESTRRLYEQILHSPQHEAPWMVIPDREVVARKASARKAEAIAAVPDVAPDAGKTNLLPVAEHALQQIRRLEQALEETRAELLQMERLIHQVMADNQQA
jgi:DNA-binding SARP family transcriptional activator